MVIILIPRVREKSRRASMCFSVHVGGRDDIYPPARGGFVTGRLVVGYIIVCSCVSLGTYLTDSRANSATGSTIEDGCTTTVESLGVSLSLPTGANWPVGCHPVVIGASKQ